MSIALRNRRQLGIAASLALPLLAAQNRPLPPLSPLATPSPPDIRGIVPAQPYNIPSLGVLWLAAGGTILLVAAGWLVWRHFRRSRPRKSAPILTPRDIAARRLQELAQRADSLAPRVFGVEICDILRAYIGAQFGLHPERQTSPEFLASIVDASVFSAAEKALLAEFLEQCDLLKFAQQDATGDVRGSLLAQAKEFVQPAPAPPVHATLGGVSS
jgi:hypothetical protein